MPTTRRPDPVTPTFRTAVATSKQTQIEEVMAASRAAATRAQPAQAKPEAVVEIKGNPFHKIIVDPTTSPEDKLAAMSSLLVFDKEKPDAENEQRLKDFVSFSEWLQGKRRELSIEMLKLNDTEAFAELKEVIDELGQGILGFNKKIQPFLGILDALHKMQTRGVKTTDLLAEIYQDNEDVDRLKKELGGYTREAGISESRIRGYGDHIADLKTETSWWTFGMKLKPSAQAEIFKTEARIEEERQAGARLAEKIQGVQTQLATPRETQFGELSDVKESVRTLVDIASDEHRQRQRELNQAAADFVTSSEGRVSKVLTNIEAMNGRIGSATTNTSRVLGIYAIMNDAIASAAEKNQGIAEGLKNPAEEEGLVAKMQREEKHEASLRHVKTIVGIKGDTIRMYDNLSKEKAELVGMQDANSQQIQATRYLHGSGIANMGMQLNAMITSLASAANGQSTKVAQELVDEMGNNAMIIRGKESLRTALSFGDVNDTLSNAIEAAAISAELMRNASTITGEALVQQRDLLDKVREGAEGIQQAIREGQQVYVDSIKPANDDTPSVTTPRSGLTGSSFDLGR